MVNAVLSTIFPDETEPHPQGEECENTITRTPPEGVPRTPLIVTCPHAGIHIPNEALKTLAVEPIELLARGDRFTDWLTVNAPNFGATQIISTIAPSFVNVGRAVTSLDPKNIRGGAGSLVTKIDKYTEKGMGQGVVAYKTLYGGFPLYRQGHEPDAAEIQTRLDTFYHPLHDTLSSHVHHKAQRRGYALVFDIHSAPSVGTHADTDPGMERPDLIFSNNSTDDGASVDQKLLFELMTLASEFGYSSSLNDPYRGGFITQTYGANGPEGSPDFIEALQVEFNRKTMGVDEKTTELTDRARFVKLQTFTNAMLQHVADYAAKKAEHNLKAENNLG